METLWSRQSPARHCQPPGGEAEIAAFG